MLRMSEEDEVDGTETCGDPISTLREVFCCGEFLNSEDLEVDNKIQNNQMTFNR